MTDKKDAGTLDAVTKEGIQPRSDFTETDAKQKPQQILKPEEIAELALKALAEAHNRVAENTQALKTLNETVGRLNLLLMNKNKALDSTPKAKESPTGPPALGIGPPIPPPNASQPERKVDRCGYNRDGTKSTTFEGCGQDIQWKDRKPYNLDGTVHRCRK